MKWTGTGDNAETVYKGALASLGQASSSPAPT